MCEGGIDKNEKIFNGVLIIYNRGWKISKQKKNLGDLDKKIILKQI
jgi:hypothetical protein